MLARASRLLGLDGLLSRSLLSPILRRLSSHYISPPPPLIDPALFREDAIDDETREVSAAAMAAAATMPPNYELSPQEARERRRAQYMAVHAAHFGNTGPPDRREDRTVSWPAVSPTPVGVSIFRPSASNAPLRGVYIQMHGGGWFMGGAAYQSDVRLLRLADRLHVAVVSVDYRLAPESTWPAPLEDCLAATCWLVENCEREFGTSMLLIGGESAGGQLCAATLLRLRAALELVPDEPLPFRACNLVYGVFDMAGTPSAKAYGTRPLVLNSLDLEWCTNLVLPPPIDRRSPDVSPLYAAPAALRGMPPALFSVGTDDPLVDDSLFMAARWAAAGNHSELAVWPGGAHGVGHFGPHEKIGLGRRCHERTAEFLDRYLR
jgi:acetyl esterase